MPILAEDDAIMVEVVLKNEEVGVHFLVRPPTAKQSQKFIRDFWKRDKERDKVRLEYILPQIEGIEDDEWQVRKENHPNIANMQIAEAEKYAFISSNSQSPNYHPGWKEVIQKGRGYPYLIALSMQFFESQYSGNLKD